MSPLLELEGVTKRFGGLLAVSDVSFTVGQGEIVGLLGPNGAGKTTLFHCITGFCRPDSGRVIFKGRDITGWSPDAICKLGAVRTFQVVESLRDMTVLENVMVGAFSRSASVGRAQARAREIVALGGMAEKRDTLAQNLTLAEKKRLEILRALATEPQLLMLDESMAGLNPSEQKDAVDLVRTIRQRLDAAILLVEHVMDVVMPLSDRVIVLDQGAKLVEGPPAVVSRDERVIRAYLGEKYAGVS